MSRENKKEIDARQQLEAQLEPSEELLAYSGGVIVGIVSTRPIYFGLTVERFILLPLKRGKPSGQALSIWRENISSMRWSGIWDRLKIKLPKGEFSIACGKRYWKKRIKNLVEMHTEAPLPQHDDIMMNERRLQQAEVFQELGLIASAQAVSEGVQSSPEIESTIPSPEILAEKRLALRVGAGFLFVNVGVLILLSALIAAGGGSLQPNLFISAIVDIIIGINLWRGQAHQWATWAIVRAVIGFIFFGIISLVQGAILDFLAQTAFCGSLVLVLTGNSNRNRTWVSIGIYVIGYLGVVLASFLVGFLANLPL
jgi:hypothetical protein